MKSQFSKSILLIAFILSVTVTYSQSSQQLENAVAFSKLYGYVKYFHPSDEAASIDWNRFAIYGSNRVNVCKNTSELKNALTELFKPIAPTLQLFLQNEKGSFNKSIVEVSNASNYKTIAWQHFGVGVSDRESIYQSARTNRNIIKASTTSTFAPANSWINASPYIGKQFIFQAKMRLASGEGQGQLWVRVDKTNKQMGFFDNMGNRRVKSKEWATYEIKGTIDGDAAKMFFGVMLVGKGIVEFDDLSLKVNEGNNWKELYTNSFTDDEAGKAPKSIGFNTTSTSYSISIKKEDDQNVATISSNDVEAESKPHQTLFAEFPKVGEYIEKSISAGLKVILPLALYGTDTQTYPEGDKELLQQLKEQLKEIPATEITGSNLNTRLGDIAVTWNVFQHFYPYFDVVKTDWNDALKKAVERAYSDKTEANFQKTLQQLTAKLKDGHVRVNSSANTNTYTPLITWEWIEGQLVVTHLGDTTLPLKVGDIVIQVDDKRAKDYFAQIYPTISAATNGWLHNRAQTESLLGEKGSEMNLKIVHANNTSAEVKILRGTNLIQYYGQLRKEDSIKLLADGMMYVNMDRASMEAINKVLPQLQKSRVIICDMRGYPNSNHDFITYLLKQKDTSTHWMQIPHTIYPDRERLAGWTYEGWQLTPAKIHLDAKIIFITDGSAISYAESYMSFIENYKLATIIGQPTAGTNGNINPFTLPGGYNISWTGMKVQKHNGATHHGVGIIPNILVNKSIKGVREGRDEFLEKAIELGKTF